MKLKYITIILIMLFCLSGCETTPQKGGMIKLNAPLGKANVEQPENAKEPAQLGYSEDGVTIPHNKGDELNVTITKEPSGKVKKEIEFKPQNEGETKVQSVVADANTGSSFEDMAAQLDVFMKNSKMIMWVGVGFLVAGGVFAGFFRDVKSGLILGGIGVTMLVGYAILPQLYANWILIVGVGVVAIPIYWYIHHKKTLRIAQASIKAHEALKIKNPELAREHSLHFKQHINPKDLDYAKKLK